MRTSTVIAGIVGGLVLAAVLVPPLYVALPARYLVNWYFMTSQGAMLGMVAALLVWVGAGFLAGSLAPEEAVRSGTAAGFLSSVLGGVVLVLPAAAVEACSDLVITTGIGRADAAKLSELTAGALLQVAWLPSASAVVLLCAGPALGAVGGVAFELWRGAPGRPGRELHLSLVPVVGLGMAVGLGVPLLWGLGRAHGAVFPALGMEPRYSALLELTAPLGILGVFTAGFLAWALRDAVALLRAGRRLTAAAWGLGSFALPPVLLVVAGVLFPRAYLSLWTLGSIGLCAVTALASVVAASRSDDLMVSRPRSFGEVLGDALLGGVLLVGQVVFVLGSMALAAWLIITPYVLALLQDAPLVDASPERLVTLVYRYHWGAGASVLLVALLWLGVAVPVWFVRRAISGRRD